MLIFRTGQFLVAEDLVFMLEAGSMQEVKTN
jgi:hypothetical protein